MLTVQNAFSAGVKPVPVFQTAGAGGAGNVGSATLAYPASIAAGDLLVMIGGNAGTSGDGAGGPTLSLGWNTIMGCQQGPVNISGTFYYSNAEWKIASGSESGNVTLGGLDSVSSSIVGRILRFSGANSITPIESPLVNAYASVTSETSPALVIAGANRLGVGGVLFIGASQSFTAWGAVTGATWAINPTDFTNAQGSIDIQQTGTLSPGTLGTANKTWAGAKVACAYGFALKG